MALLCCLNVGDDGDDEVDDDDDNKKHTLILNFKVDWLSVINWSK